MHPYMTYKPRRPNAWAAQIVLLVHGPPVGINNRTNPATTASNTNTWLLKKSPAPYATHAPAA